MSRDKDAYFDSKVEADWASNEYSDEELRKIDRMLRLAEWTPDMRVLEPGCGTGRLTALLAQRAGPKGSILAADISSNMAEAARERTSEFPRVMVECIPLESLGLSPQEFDLVVCHQVFPHFDDKRSAVRKMADCLRPGGRVVIFHLINSTQINDMHRKTDPSEQSDSMPGPEEMSAMLNDNGFALDLLEDDDRGYLLIATRILENL